jgi:hypothetical protein
MPERFFERDDVVHFAEISEGLVSIEPESGHAAESLFHVISGMSLQCTYAEQSNMITVRAGSIKLIKDLLHALRQNQGLISRVSISSRDRDPLKEILKEAA